MSVQSVSSAPVATDPGPARKRAAEADSGQTTEAFALPDAAPETAAAPGAPAKSDAKIEAPAAQVEPAAKAAPAAPVVIAPDPTGAKPVAAVPKAPSQPALPQSGVDALLAAAIAAQGETLPKKDTDKVGEKDEAESGGEAAPALVDPAALPVVAPVATDATQSHAAAEALAAAAFAGAPATAGGAVPAADTPVAAAAPATGAIAALTTAATGSPAAQTALATGPLQGSQTDTAKGPEAGLADTAGAGAPAAHLAKGGAVEPAPPGAAQDVAPPEFKLTEALQPLQGAIDLSALTQARPARPDTALAALTPEQTAAAQAANAQAQTATDGPPTPLHVVPIEIGLRALAGGRKFDIRLDPAELGRVDVSLDISDAGEVTAKLVVDRVETLHMLQRDARTLERAFEQAGLKPSNAGVEITLRDPADQGFRQNRQHDEAPRRTPSLADLGDDLGLSAQPVQSTTIRGLVRLGGVDLSI